MQKNTRRIPLQSTLLTLRDLRLLQRNGVDGFMPLPVPNFLQRRPRVLNILHKARLVKACSSTTEAELTLLARHASGRHLAVEIGTAFGVSAVRISQALAPNGTLYCVDTFERDSAVSKICERELRRAGTLKRVVFLRGSSTDMSHDIPNKCEFFFVDGDHTYKGLQGDWEIVLRRLVLGGVACFHDTTIPPDEPQRDFGSVHFFDDVIRPHPDFELLETCYSLNVLRRVRC